jgi:hypothetical protein
LNSGPHTCQAGTPPLQPLHQPFFCVGYFRDRVSQTICMDYPQTVILLFSASWVAGIPGVTHHCLACLSLFLILCLSPLRWLYHSLFILLSLELNRRLSYAVEPL